MQGEEATKKLALLGQLAALALLLAASFPRARGLEASFDRGIDGERGSRASLTQWNRQRLPEIQRPITAIEIPAGTHTFAGIGQPPWEELVRVSDSVLGADLALERLSFDFLEIDAGDPRAPVEFAVRLPFLAVHLLALLAIWWAVAQALGKQIALMTLAFLAVSPPSIAYSGLSGTENLALLGVGLLLGVHARFLRMGFSWKRPLPLLLLAPLSLLLAPETLAVLALLPLHALLLRRVRHAAWLALTCWLPALALHAEFGPQLLRERTLEHLAVLQATDLIAVQELFHQSVLRFAPVVLVLAGIGLLLRLSRALHPRWRLRLEALEFPAPSQSSLPRVEVGGLVLLAGLLMARSSVESRGAAQLFLTPAVALGLALFLQQLTRPIAGMRAGIAPLVVASSLIAMPCLARFAAFEREVRSDPTPRTTGLSIRELELPPDSLCVIPDSLWNGLALEYYAGRSLVSQDLFDRAAMGTIAVKRGILPWSPVLLLPATEDGETSSEARLRETTVHRGTQISQNSQWQAWAIR